MNDKENSLFFSNVDNCNNEFENILKEFCDYTNDPVYLIKHPLLQKDVVYNYRGALLILSKYKLLFVDFDENNEEEFENYKDDFLEDLGYISTKYNYQSDIGRPRTWKVFFESIKYSELKEHIKSLGKFINFLKPYEIDDKYILRKQAYLRSLAVGSINDIKKIGGEFPETVLEKIKKKIILFDGDQTRFIYKDDFSVTPYYIQGLAGTGKTELLLHKLKDLYISDSKSRIVFTCYSTILADSMLKRVPDFFDFMKVEEQIKWNERLWVMRSWGSQNNINSGLYSYICNFYDIPFYRYSPYTSFDDVCKNALEKLNKIIKETGKLEKCFDFILIDESQDFPKSFFELCELVTNVKVYAAGDIFQDLYDRDFGNKKYNLLLNKCYRTDPKTLMFSHALGMGLYEKPIIRWLSDEDWEMCGYSFQRNNSQICFTRKPLNRFEDIPETIKNIDVRKCNFDYESISQSIISIIDEIMQSNVAVTPDDIAIVFGGETNNQYMYSIIDMLEYDLAEKYHWRINKGYESKCQIENTLMISSRNYIKGLEYPFIICVAPNNIDRSIRKRNSLYMILTRSFITSYFIMNSEDEIYNIYKQAADSISINGVMCINEPDDDEKLEQNNKFEMESKGIVDADKVRKMVVEAVDKHNIPTEDLLNAIQLSVDTLIKNNPELKYNEDLLRKRIDSITISMKV